MAATLAVHPATRCLVAVLGTAIISGASDPALPSGVPVEIVDVAASYTVDAVDAEGLVREMAERGPQHPTGRRAWAYTAWSLRARYVIEPAPTGCRLLDPAVVLDVTTTLPRWQPRSRPSRRLRSGWDRMLRKARAHEAEHRRHAVDAANDAAAQITTIRTGGACADLERSVRSALRKASTAAAQRSRVFDRDTDYGRGQGVGLAD